jgi:hypothetical protein
LRVIGTVKPVACAVAEVLPVKLLDRDARCSIRSGSHMD